MTERSEPRFPTRPGDMGELFSREDRRRMGGIIEQAIPSEMSEIIRRLLLTLDQKDGEIELLREACAKWNEIDLRGSANA